jgi:hypothetical protein
MEQLSKNTLPVLVITPTAGAAGTADIESTIVDTAGYGGVQFVIQLGAITSGAVTSAYVQQNTANSTSGMATLAGTTATIADDDDGQYVVIDVARPAERYVRLVVDRGTQNAVVAAAHAYLYNPSVAPVTNSDSAHHSTISVVTPDQA